MFFLKNKFFIFLYFLFVVAFSERGFAIGCSAGWYVGNDDNCRQCPIGTYNPEPTSGGIEQCLACPENTYNENTGRAACTPCPDGSTTQNVTGSDSYQDCKCAAGMFMSSGSSHICKPCINPAYTSDEGTIGSTSNQACTICNVGFQRNGDVCEECPVGQYKADVGDGPCLVCSDATYTPNTGMTECLQCPMGHCCAGGRRYQCNKGTWADIGVACRSGTRALNNSSFKKGMCIPCNGGCTTMGKGAVSNDECVIKSAKRFCIGGVCFSWPDTGEISEQPLNDSISSSFSCPAGAAERD